MVQTSNHMQGIQSLLLTENVYEFHIYIYLYIIKSYSATHTMQLLNYASQKYLEVKQVYIANEKY